MRMVASYRESIDIEKITIMVSMCPASTLYSFAMLAVVYSFDSTVNVCCWCHIFGLFSFSWRATVRSFFLPMLCAWTLCSTCTLNNVHALRHHRSVDWFLLRSPNRSHTYRPAVASLWFIKCVCACVCVCVTICIACFVTLFLLLHDTHTYIPAMIPICVLIYHLIFVSVISTHSSLSLWVCW